MGADLDEHHDTLSSQSEFTDSASDAQHLGDKNPRSPKEVKSLQEQPQIIAVREYPLGECLHDK